MASTATSTALSISSALPNLVARGASLGDIAAFLDALSHEARLAQVIGSPRSMQPVLYDLAAKAAPLDLDAFVPRQAPPGKIVHHHGWNNLPIPAFGRRFAKPMSRCPDGSGFLYGYNQSPFGPLIGPGYFVHTPTAHEPGWAERGGTVIDYHRVPAHPVPADWPPVVPNSRGLQMFVYNGTRDFMRRVSAHVTIGAAYKGDKRLGAYFMLVRQDG
jgi:hypothetical protein